MKCLFFLVGLGLSSLLFTIVACQKSDSLELVWSARRGLVGNWEAVGDEVYTVGRNLSVYTLSTGRELRRVGLAQDYGNSTFGEISPKLAISTSCVSFGWYDFKGEFKETQGKIFCHDTKTLQLRWERSLPLRKDVAEVAPTFSLVVDGQYLYALAIGREEENLFKLEIADGKTIWSATVAKYADAPVILHDGKLLVHSVASIAHPDQYGYFQAISAETGKLIWRLRIDGLLNLNHPALIAADRAYLTSRAVLNNPDNFYTIDLRTGTIVDHQRAHRLHAPFAEHQGILYFGGNNPAAFDINGKKFIWQTDLHSADGIGDPIGANGVFDPARHEIYLGDWERYLYILSSTTGQIKEKIDIRAYWRGDVLFNPVKAVFASYGVKRLQLHQGLLIVGTVDSSLFVFRPRTKN